MPYEFDDSVVAFIWNKAKLSPKHDKDVTRKDYAGAWIKKSEYGLKSEYGWVIDLIRPVLDGGSENNIKNLASSHWRNYESRNHEYPTWKTAYTASEGGRDILRNEPKEVIRHAQKKSTTSSTRTSTAGSGSTAKKTSTGAKHTTTGSGSTAKKTTAKKTSTGAKHTTTGSGSTAKKTTAKKTSTGAKHTTTGSGSTAKKTVNRFSNVGLTPAQKHVLNKERKKLQKKIQRLRLQKIQNEYKRKLKKLKEE